MKTFLALLVASAMFAVLSVSVFLLMELAIWLGSLVLKFVTWNPALSIGFVLSAIFVWLMYYDVYLWVEKKLKKSKEKREKRKFEREERKRLKNVG